jgi:hypothetical protein
MGTPHLWLFLSGTRTGEFVTVQQSEGDGATGTLDRLVFSYIHGAR